MKESLPPPDERPERIEHGACKGDSPPTQDETDSITGRVIETPFPTNDETYYSAGRLRESHEPLIARQIPARGHVVEIETSHSPNDVTDARMEPVGYDQIDSSTGRVRETPHPPNDGTDSSTGRLIDYISRCVTETHTNRRQDILA